MSKGNKKLKKFKITSIYGWEEDRHMEDGDACHCSEGDVMRKRLHEYEQKIENYDWPGLPFECTAEDERDAIGKYNKAHCEYDYFLATEAEFEDRHDFDEVKLRQVMGLADDNTMFRIDKGDKGEDLCVFNADFSDDCDGVCELVDPLLDRRVAEFSVGVSEDPANGNGGKRTVPTVWIRLHPEDDVR